MVIGFSIKFPHRVTITSALPYVNGVKHLGNIAGSLLPADIFHRFLDLFGVKNIFICGTDDHGTAVELAAKAEGISPREYAEKYYKIQKEIYEKWGFDFTHFGQTSSKSNHEITQDLFAAAHHNGYIIKKNLVIPYCTECRRYLPDRYITGTCPNCNYPNARGDQCEKCGRILDTSELIKPKCAVCGKSAIEFREEKHLFLDFTSLQPKLREWIESNKHWPDNTRNFALGWIREGLRPRGITRNLKWGIKVPLKGYEHLVFYVWFDAPIAYISITKDGVKNWKEWWTHSKIYHFVGKDNVPFHTIFWPGTLIAAKKYVLPHHVEGYEYLNWEGEKFSTSLGNGLFSDEALDLFPADYWRFYLASVLPENKDSNFDWEDFRKRINNELIANYGNLFYRATHFIEKNFGGKMPKGETGEEEQQIQWKLDKTIGKVEELVSQVKLKEALKEIFIFTNVLNKYFQDRKPWDQINEDKKAAATTLSTTINALNSLSLLLTPYIPESAWKAVECLGNEKKLKAHVKPGQKIRAEILFEKIDSIEDVKSYRSKYAKGVKAKHNKTPDSPDVLKVVDNMLPIEEFKKVEMKIATVKSVKDHPKADKLYVIEVDTGKEIRKIVAGLRDKYKPDELKGRQVIIVTNLEPKELRGIRSEGMLLAAEDGTILEPSKKVKDGSKIM